MLLQQLLSPALVSVHLIAHREEDEEEEVSCKMLLLLTRGSSASLIMPGASCSPLLVSPDPSAAIELRHCYWCSCDHCRYCSRGELEGKIVLYLLSSCRLHAVRTWCMHVFFAYVVSPPSSCLLDLRLVG